MNLKLNKRWKEWLASTEYGDENSMARLARFFITGK